MAARHDLNEMARIIGVDSLAFISMDGLYRAVGETGRNAVRPQFCDACFSGEYPVSLTDRDGGSVPKQLSFLTEIGNR
jgi:amidophosphoribosyltransferase